jgi:hypothetical protein
MHGNNSGRFLINSQAMWPHVTLDEASVTQGARASAPLERADKEEAIGKNQIRLRA